MTSVQGRTIEKYYNTIYCSENIFMGLSHIFQQISHLYQENSIQAKEKNMCVYGHMSKKSRVGLLALIFF
jgi:hypothetical protein